MLFKKKSVAVIMSIVLAFQFLPCIGSVDLMAGIADSYSVPEASSTGTVGADMPYTRYDSKQAELGGGAVIAESLNVDRYAIASQASERSYVRLPENGSYAQWTVSTSGDGVTMRFTMPDSEDGYGISGSLDVYVNGKYVKTVDLTSYYMWQYFAGGNPSDSNDGGVGCFAFDEVHFKLDKALNSGDTIRIQSTYAGGVEYGVDFLEIEQVPEEISKPENSLSVVDYGAIPNDNEDDLAAIQSCVAAANSQGKTVYFPAGTFNINQIWSLSAANIKITGAGMWYTNIKFTNSAAGSGGISGNCYNVEFCNMYLNSSLRSRYNQNAVYKCFMDIFADGSVIHDVWEEHFECGVWMADYSGQGRYSDGLRITNCRIRNNLADGVNFCQGTSNAAVYNCSIRNNGDDGLAVWNNNYNNVKDSTNIVFANNTIDFIWRAGGIAIYGGNGHKIYNNYICDSFMSSGIHLNTTFDGYKFTNTTNIEFSNNTLVRTGSGCGSWGEEFGAVDIEGNVHNITFNNTKIYDAEHDGIHLNGALYDVTFNNTVIEGAGVDGQQYSYSSPAHSGAAIMTINSPTAIFNNIQTANIAYSGVNYITSGNISINEQEKNDTTEQESADTTEKESNDTTEKESNDSTASNNSLSIALDSSLSQSPLVKNWSVTGTSGYEYLGYAYMGGSKSAGYRYLLITYTGDNTAFDDLRLEFPSGKVYGLISTAYDGVLKTINGDTVPKPASTSQTAIIDLVASGIDVAAGIEGIHLHQTAGNGNFTISKAYLMTSVPTNETQAPETTEEVTTEVLTTQAPETTEVATEVLTTQAPETTEVATEVLTTQAPETTEVTTEEQTTTDENDDVLVELNGYQINTTLEGYRVVYSLSDQNNKVQEVGLVYGLTDRMADDELVVGSENEYVYSYAATENGVLSKNFSTFSNGISYARTMEFNDASVDFFRQEISVRAYAKLKDGTYKYSDIGNLTIYSVADKLYQQNKMKTAYSHNYLFDKILSRVNADYEKVEFNWANIIVQA